MATSKRDPFAPLGTAGNRGITFGTDAPIPGKHSNLMESAIRLAYQLAGNHAFNKAFESILIELSVPNVKKDAYLTALDRIVLNQAEGSKHPKAIDALQKFEVWSKADKTFQQPRAFSYPNQPEVWVRKSLLALGSDKLVAGAIMHEAAHVAGAPGNDLAEFLLLTLDGISGYGR